jgi:hypothetical protein
VRNIKKGKTSSFFVRIGELLPGSLSRKISIVGERIALGSWFKSHFKGEIHPVNHRFELLSIGLQEIERDFVYLEFGVASGDSMRHVADKAIEMEGVELHGFDTFTGLSESHHDAVMIGSFNQFGATPQIEGVNWHVGFFQETFFGDEDYLESKLFVMMDADLYSSTRYILEKIALKLKDGDLVYFDDLHIPNQERLALSEALRKGLKLKLVGRSAEGRSALFRIIGN